jgi:hypothetical protein
MALCFTANSVVHVWEFIRQQLSAPVAICSELQLVSSVVRHGAVYSRVTCISA